MELELDHEVEGDHDLLTPHGEVDVATHVGLRDAMARLLAAGRNHLVVDLTKTTFIDSTALGCLIGARSNAVASGGTFAVVCSDPRIVRLFDITRLSEVFTRFESREDWAASLAPPT